MEITTKIRVLRNEKGYSQHYVADRLNLSSRTYNRLECGISRLYYNVLSDIANLYEITLTELVKDC